MTNNQHVLITNNTTHMQRALIMMKAGENLKQMKATTVNNLSDTMNEKP